MALDTLIFGVDGVLSETLEARRESFNEVFKEAGLKWHWDRALYQQLLKSTSSGDLIREFAKANAASCRNPQGLSAMIAAMQRRHAALFHERIVSRRVGMRSGAAQLLIACARDDIRLAVVTTETEANVATLLKTELSPSFAARIDIITPADLEDSDDRSAMHAKALQLLGLSTRNCLVVESTARGLESALAAKLPVLLTWGRYPELEECGKVLFERQHASLNSPFSAIVSRWDCAPPADILDHLRAIHAAQIRISRPRSEFTLERALAQ